MLPDDQLDALLRAAKPRAPAGFEDRVMSQVRPAWRAWTAVAAAAVLVLGAGWFLSTRVVHPRAAIMPRDDGSRWFNAANGRELAQGETVGKSELHSDWRKVSIEQSATVWRSFIRLDAGQATLLGDDIVVDTSPARVTTISPDAEVEVAMNAKKVGATVIAAGAAVLSIHVLRGAAKVEPAAGASVQQPVLLAQGDRALVTTKRPPTILRAPHPTTPAATANTPERSSAIQRPAGQPAAIQPPPAPIAPEPGSLDKDTIRTGIKSIIPRVEECYTHGLERNPKLAGKIVVKFVIRTKDGRGRIDEGEIDSENDELQSPLVEQCILTAMAEIDFPAPSGGGEVHVSYPFVLANDGEPNDQSHKTDRNR
jgi:hypothetical protein